MLRKLSNHISKRTAIILISLILIVAIAVATTIAYVIVKTNTITNTFEPGKVIVEINQTNGVVTNTKDSDVSAYVRVALIVNYQDQNGNIWSTAPTAGIDYSLSAVSADQWLIDRNGFYYYTSPLAPEETSTTPVTIASIPTSTNNKAATADGYTLTVTYLVTAIQSLPTTAAENAWGITVGTDGKITNVPTA